MRTVQMLISFSITNVHSLSVFTIGKNPVFSVDKNKTKENLHFNSKINNFNTFVK